MAIDWTRWDSDPSYSSVYGEVHPPWVRPARPSTMRWSLQLVTPPTADPVTLERIKWHNRVGFDDDDQLLLMYMGAARQYVEMRTGLCLMPQTWLLVLDRWPRQDRMEFWPVAAPLGAILLPRYPVQSITSVIYTDSDGAPHTVASNTYVTDLVARPPRIAPATAGGNWPSISLYPVGAIQVKFVAGYATVAQIPPVAIQAISLMVGHWYENREAVTLDARHPTPLPLGVQALIDMLSPVFVG